jgi:YHS domain-containing protein
MWKFLIIALACVVLYKLITNDRGKRERDEQKSQERKIAKGEMVKDPVCGAYVEREGAISVRDGEKTHIFCSYDCRRKFLNELQRDGRELPPSTHEEDE